MLISWLALVARSAEPTVADALPLQVRDETRWAGAQERSTRAAKVSAGFAIAGGAALGLGAALLASGDPQLEPVGTALAVPGTIGAVFGPPLLLASSVRANRALRERGVYTSTLSGALGWTLFGAGVLVVPVGVVAAPGLIPVWYGGVVALGEVQLGVNARGAAAALTPTSNGIALRGTF
jgi:hypothetical protein